MKKLKLTIEKFFIRKCNLDHITSKVNKKRIYFSGKIVLIMPEDIHPGMNVLTSDGIGIIDKEEHIDIILKTTRVRLQKGYSIQRNFREVYQYATYNRLLGKFIPISSACYSYIIDDHQEIQYRITKRGFAMLHEEYMKRHEYINIFNSKRGGRSMLLHLKKEGFDIVNSKL